MMIWDQYVGMLQAAIFAYSQACGGNLGWGIILVTLMLRAAMLPLSLKFARLTAAHQASMKTIQPEIDKLRNRYRSDPQRLSEAMRRLLDREGVSLLPKSTLIGALVQMPVFIGLFSAVRRCAGAGGRFLWIGNLAKPDLLLTAAVTALTCASVFFAGQSSEQNKLILIAVPAVITFLVLSKLSAGLGVYWAASNLVSLIQAAILYRERRLAARAS